MFRALPSGKRIAVFMTIMFIFALCASLFCRPSESSAHSNTFVLSDISVVDHKTVKMVLRVDVLTIREIAGPVDRNNDGIIDDKELSKGYNKLIAPYLVKGIVVKNNGKELPLIHKKQDIPNPNVLRFEFAFPAKQYIRNLTVQYDDFYDVAPNHNNIAVFHLPKGKTFQYLFSAQNKQWSGVFGQTPPVTETIKQFIELGIEHILTGYDHLLFLFALLLVGIGFRQMLGIITSFTIAHSITLALAALNIVTLPSRFVESFIALSIVYVVIENVFRAKNIKYRWALTFGFGLIHGFGFASVLREIGLPKQQEIYALFTFNIGVEIGQMAVVCIVLPLLLAFNKRRWYPRLQISASCVIGVLGGFWFISRAFGIS